MTGSFVKRWPGWLLLGLVVVGLLAVGATADSGPRTPEERVEEISKRIACPVCDGESVFDSRNNASAAIRTEITRQVAANTLTDEEIVTLIEQNYGGQVLLVPRATGLDALVWVLPVFVAVCAVVGLILTFRRWKRESAEVGEPDDEDRALVAEALARET
jgi:cytochrome c-type biogenesis protein CcmH